MENERRPRRRARTVTPSLGSDFIGLDDLRHGSDDPADGLARDLPVLPVRNTVLLPRMVAPLFVDQAPALNAVEAATAIDHTILIVAQRSEHIADPIPQDIYEWGTECVINRVVRMPDNTTSVMVQGVRRFRIQRWVQRAPYGRVRGLAYEEPASHSTQLEALARTVLSTFRAISRLSQRLNEEAYIQALNIDRPGALADYVVAQLEPPIQVRQDILETLDPAERLRRTLILLQRESTVLEMEKKIQDDVQQEVDNGQREFFLREQMRVIQRELTGHDPAVRDVQELRDRIEATGMPQETREKAEHELERLEAMPSMAPEHGVLRAYLDWLASLPWTTRTQDHLDLHRVAELLDERHYGLNKVKDRIIEYMAVRKLAPEGRTPILCLAGPPGVGKTSLGRSIAEALGRKFVRVSLGGVRDEAEIRGHRRTYVGALPGRIIQAMKQARVVNPVFVLDEIDKLAADFRGDPAAALLEALDPEQNNSFSDHYLEVPYDLSQALFIMTANVLDTIPSPLRDRMEVIELPSYTEEEKVHIARRFLIPRQMADAGLTETRIEIDDDAVRRIVREYTYEAGVRNLERELGAIMRRVARRVAEGRRHKAHVTAQRVPAYLGQQKHFPTEAEERDEIGVATGLAWTAAGGDLTTVEVMAVAGHGAIMLTGRVGDVMKESAQAALTYIRARADALGLAPDFYERSDIHVHLPAASIPKDGPSAGVTMAIAMISALTGRETRRDVAMTGEITLRGRVLPVGGVKEKALAAHRAGILTVILPRRNVKDLDELPVEVREALTIIPVDTMDDVLCNALRAPARHPAPEPAPHVSGGLTRATTPSRPLGETIAAAGRLERARAPRDVIVAG
ncbi:MAG TPA: endopeptidase La [Ktedonobacterales bacterium]|nr:endopeptidase La [Ktedonobacterales bacterium]